MKTAIYARVSTDDQNCEMQLTALREYVAARGWKLAGEHVDQGFSGAKTKRPALDKLLTAARQRKLDCIVVWKLDRFGRSLAHLTAMTGELASLGVRFIATTQGIDTDASNPTAKLLLNLMACFAEFERELIRERTVAGQARARAKGVHCGRPRLVYRKDKVLELVAAGASYRDVAAKLNLSLGTVQRCMAAN
jgi:putative DNA-invertase from lambdoid prophage Rac